MKLEPLSERCSNAKQLHNLPFSEIQTKVSKKFSFSFPTKSLCWMGSWTAWSTESQSHCWRLMKNSTFEVRSRSWLQYTDRPWDTDLPWDKHNFWLQFSLDWLNILAKNVDMIIIYLDIKACAYPTTWWDCRNRLLPKNVYFCPSYFSSPRFCHNHSFFYTKLLERLIAILLTL